MKKLLLILTLLTPLASAFAATCQPYTIPAPGTAIACQNGPGLQYLTKTQTCPNGATGAGVITTSTTYVTSGCQLPITTPECTSGCATSGTSPNCQPGEVWTNQVTSNDPNVVAGVYHCAPQQNCNATSVDSGTTAACSVFYSGYTGLAYLAYFTTYNGSTNCTKVGSSWDTSGCVAPVTPPPPVTCTAGSVNNASVACGVGFNGQKYTTTTTSCPSGIYGSPVVTTSGYNTSGCTALGVTCTPGTVNNAPVACGTGFNGTKYTTTSTACPSGSYGAPVTTTSAYITTGCTAQTVTCTAGATVNTYACSTILGTGYTGNATTTTTISCPSGAYGSPTQTTSAYNTSACKQLVCNAPQILNPAKTACITPTCNATPIASGTESCAAAGKVGYGVNATLLSYSTYNGVAGCTPASAGVNTSSCVPTVGGSCYGDVRQPSCITGTYQYTNTTSGPNATYTHFNCVGSGGGGTAVCTSCSGNGC